MPMVSGERFELAMGRATCVWACGLALVLAAGVVPAAAQEGTPAEPRAATLSAQAAVVLAVAAPEAAEHAAEPADSSR